MAESEGLPKLSERKYGVLENQKRWRQKAIPYEERLKIKATWVDF